MFPLVSAELSFEFDPERALLFGMLPMAVTTDSPRDYLRTYAETYLVQEIQAEALTRNLGAFARFLEIAARRNGQVTNVAGIARGRRNQSPDRAEPLRDSDGHAGRILAASMEAEVRLPNRYGRASSISFDCGVARALTGRLAYPPASEELGPLAETFILNELRAYLGYSAQDYKLCFWCSYDGVEVDVLCETVEGFVAIEIKASSRWDKRFNRGLHRVRDDLGKDRTTCYGVYLGERAALWDDVRVLPLVDFSQAPVGR